MTQHHDPVHPDSPHLSPELIADLDEGLLDPESTAHAEHHLAQCPRCSAVRDDLADTSGALASLPPVPMPADRVLALEAAMQTWAPAAAAPVAAAAGPRRDTVVPLEAARSRRTGWSTRLVTAAASVAGVLLVSAVGYSMVAGPSDGQDGGAVQADAGSGTPEDVALESFVAERSGRSYRQRSFDAQVDTLLVASESDVTPDPSVTPEDLPSSPAPMVTATVKGSPTAFVARITDPTALKACIVDYLLLPDAVPLVVDVGTFMDRPAAVIVMPSPDDPAEAEVYVVDPDCSGPDATLLYFAVVDLPEELLR